MEGGPIATTDKGRVSIIYERTELDGAQGENPTSDFQENKSSVCGAIGDEVDRRN